MKTKVGADREGTGSQNSLAVVRWQALILLPRRNNLDVRLDKQETPEMRLLLSFDSTLPAVVGELGQLTCRLPQKLFVNPGMLLGGPRPPLFGTRQPRLPTGTS